MSVRTAILTMMAMGAAAGMTAGSDELRIDSVPTYDGGAMSREPRRPRHTGARSKYMPHQGKQEMARRVRQMSAA